MTDLASGTITIKKDVVAGVFIAAFAIGFGAIAWNYSFGNVSQMGPGFFPLILSAVLGCLGLAVAVRGIFSSAEQMTFVAPIRLLFVLASPLLFGVLVRPAGFLLAVTATAFVGTLAAPGMRILTRLIVSGVLAVLATAVFIWGLGLPLAAFGRWFTL
ncbi:tripartite tricarboxylate transporter TctB family protein [Sinorhizobium medicae]|uniref:Tripartite tricarboxylate transporter TctB family protein n=1 Tax=Sinorhizobium medicae TaxID=110321 RepID=A0A6G1WH55_9HYPH|nr:tripartite tricarboxylate transporter TctB family protein [Sinorhizobium medicae]MBO1959848.1 tripartite tricarboxylate transporter TctB family protein [Sinorhizobium medicae]MDX1010197.1 tripartite tricarboxylate transporter TctB family protein [Sinorhizobium medicae]MDX1052884.1 tripartite tricarboxylate transporter TctB family protein [Sinorhizobium medicae]MDX1218772.1 tripartite tricarboxylate transporter TctB family protein [Sinorhizobium medicae]MQV99174.1 tripartite tricarboxylate t